MNPADVIVLETERLRLRWAGLDDAPFLLRLLNEPSFLEFIGDRGVRDLETAQAYVRDRLIASYREYGFGLYLVERREDGAPLGICGLVRRAGLPDVDVGFALLPEFWQRGYAFEATAAVLEHAWRDLRLSRVVAITSPHNRASQALLEKAGLRFEAILELPVGGQRVDTVYLYATGQTAS